MVLVNQPKLQTILEEKGDVHIKDNKNKGLVKEIK